MKKILTIILLAFSTLANAQITSEDEKLISTLKAEMERSGKTKTQVDEQLGSLKNNLKNRNVKINKSARTSAGAKAPLTKLCVDNIFEDKTNPWFETCMNHYGVAAYLPNGLSAATCNPITKTGTGSSEHYMQVIPFTMDPFLLTTSPAYTLPSRPIGSGTYSLKLGHANDGFAAEKISRTFVVSASTPVFFFKYALVMTRSHSNADGTANGSEVFFNARALDNSGAVIDEVMQIGNPSNSFTQKTNSGSIYFIDWQCSSLDLSKHIGQTVTIEFMNADCAGGAHWGYTYLDDFCVECEESLDASVKVDTCFVGNTITGSFTPPTIGTNTGVLQSLQLQFYNAGVAVGPAITSYTTSGNNFSFSGVSFPTSANCFDVVVTANFQITNPFSGNISTLEKASSNKNILGQEEGSVKGFNNDICNCCNCQQTLSPFLSWSSGTGAKGDDKLLQLTCGATLTDKLDCFQPYSIKLNSPCGADCQPDSIITKITYPGGGSSISYSLTGTPIIANQVGTYTVSIKVKCGGKWCAECKITFKQTKKCEPPCDNCKVNGQDKVTIDFDDAASTSNISNFPGTTLLNTVFTLGGGADTYTEVRVNVVDFQISSDKPTCLQCYGSASQWGSIAAGNIPGFTPAITSYPAVTASSPFNNPREIVFSASPATAIPLPTKLYLKLKIPGVNPLSCCCIKVTMYLKITYRNNKCEECSKIVRVAFTQCGGQTDGGTSTGTFDPNPGWPQFRMHAPNPTDASIINAEASSSNNRN